MHPGKQVTDLNIVETVGELFVGGASLELVLDPECGVLRLLFTENQKSYIASEIEYGGRIYRPIGLDPRILKAISFPKELADYVSTEELFSEIRGTFQRFGFSGEVSQIGTHFVFSASFPDCLAEAPCLLVSGPQAEVRLFFQILGCLVRHAVHLADVNRTSLSLLTPIRPTLLISQGLLSNQKLKLLFETTIPNLYFPNGKELTNFYCAKVIHTGMHQHEDVLGEAKLRMNLCPLRGNIPYLTLNEQSRIAAKFQPKLLCYRAGNWQKVRDSNFDFSWLTSGSRMLARILGSCIIDAPDIQAELTSYFQSKQRASREHIWVDHRCVAMEVGLALCHSEEEKRLVYVGAFTDDMNTTLRGRGNPGSLEPKEVGSILRELGFSPKRGRKGYALLLSDEVRRKIHKVAFEYDVAALLDGKPRCEHCRQIFKVETAEAPQASGKEEAPDP